MSKQVVVSDAQSQCIVLKLVSNTSIVFTVEAALISSKVTVQGGNLPGLYNATKITLHWGKGNSTIGSEHTVDGKQYPMEV